MISKNSTLGFTLIELLIVIAIVGILAAVAYPSYERHVVKTNRADAQANLLELSQNLERRFTELGNYTGATLGFNVSPKSGATRYDLTLPGGSLSANAYTIVATPTSIQRDTDCGILNITSTGVKCATDSGTLKCSNSATAADRAFVATCW